MTMTIGHSKNKTKYFILLLSAEVYRGHLVIYRIMLKRLIDCPLLHCLSWILTFDILTSFCRT